MGSNTKPHAVCVPFPAQGHINPVLKLAKLLHHRGFHITFVNTEFNHRRLLRSRGLDALDGLPDFRFVTISDGLPPSDADATQDVPSLCDATTKNCLAPFCSVLHKLKDESGSGSGAPPVTCIISDAIMSFTVKAAEDFGLRILLFWTASACGLLGYAHYHHLVKRGFIPLKDMCHVTNGYLETTIDWIPGLKDVRLRDLPSFIRTTDPKDIMLNFFIGQTENIPKCSALILNTFDAFEQDALNAASAIHPRLYTIGPLQFMENQVQDERLQSLGSNLWKEDSGCIEWLDTQEPNSVIFVNFGSITMMSADQLIEFAWGLANSKKPFLWIIRPDIVAGDDSKMLPPEFAKEIKERSMLASWCPQEQVLKHPSISGFLTHCGWNSTLDSVCSGVPIICWPFFAEQQTNCRYSCTRWGIGLEIDNNVKRDEVEMLVRELTDGEKGNEMKKKAMEWKNKAQEATSKHMGSSYINFDKLLKEIL